MSISCEEVLLKLTLLLPEYFIDDDTVKNQKVDVQGKIFESSVHFPH